MRGPAPLAPARRWVRTLSTSLHIFGLVMFSVRIRARFAGTRPGRGGGFDTSWRGLATALCPSDYGRVALAGSIEGTGCTCSQSRRQLPTPSSSNFSAVDVPRMLERRRKLKGKHGNGNGFGLTLGQYLAVEFYKTPSTRDYKGTNVKRQTNGRATSTLPDQLMTFFRTHKARDHWGGSSKAWTERTMGGGLPSICDQLGGAVPHPEFLEELMGFPKRWTELKH